MTANSLLCCENNFAEKSGIQPLNNHRGLSDVLVESGRCLYEVYVYLLASHTLGSNRQINYLNKF